MYIYNGSIPWSNHPVVKMLCVVLCHPYGKTMMGGSTEIRIERLITYHPPIWLYLILFLTMDRIHTRICVYMRTCIYIY